MGELAINHSVMGTQTSEKKIANPSATQQGGINGFAALLQSMGLSTSSITTPLALAPQTELSNEKMESEDIQKLISDLIAILEGGKNANPQNELVKWFSGLEMEEQENLLGLVNKLTSFKDLGANVEKMESSKLFGFQVKESFVVQETLTSETMMKDSQNTSASKTTEALLQQLQPFGKELKEFKQKIEALLKNNFAKSMEQPEKILTEVNNEEAIVNAFNKNKSMLESKLPLSKHHLGVQSVQHVTEADVVTQVTSEVAELDVAKPQQVGFQAQMRIEHGNSQLAKPTVENLYLNQNVNFSDEFGKVLIKNIKLPNGISETKIQLHPQELGQLDVKLVANNGHISAQIITESSISKQLLEAQIHQLKQSLVQQGYQVEKVEVQQASSSSLNQDAKNGFHFSDQGSHKQQQNKHKSSDKQDIYSYSEHLNDDMDGVNGIESGRISNLGIDYSV